MRRGSLLGLAVIVLFAPAAFARTLEVPAEFATIQGAISAAADGDSVLVAPGLYVEAIEFGGKSLVLRATGKAAATTIRAPAGAQTAVIRLVPGSDATTVIRGFTVDGDGRVNGIHCLASDPLVAGCIIENCQGEDDGGGVWLQQCAARIVGNEIRLNATPISGGGIFVRLGTGHEPVRILGNLIYDNVAGNAGGIACIEGEGALIEHNVVHHNRLRQPDSAALGAVFIRADRCRIRNNTIADNDGGITIAMSVDTDVRNNIVVGNARGGLIVNPYVGMPVGLVYAYNDFWNNAAGNYLLTPPGTLDISADPLFMGGPGDLAYAPGPDSPCIEAGDPALTNADGTRSDMGAVRLYAIGYPGWVVEVPRDFPTIQAAIDAAGSGDRSSSPIYVAPGTYRERLDFQGKAIDLVAVEGPERTHIAPPRERHDGRPQPGQGALITIGPGPGGQWSRIRGFHLDGEGTAEGLRCTGSFVWVTGCLVENCASAGDGGGMRFEDCSPLVEKCIVRHNRAGGAGGGIFLRPPVGQAQARVLDNEIGENAAADGGGIVCLGGAALIERNRIWGNRVDSPRSECPGAVTLLADGCVVRNNTISFNDGGITLAGTRRVDLRNNIVTGNFAGGLIVNDYWRPTFYLTHDYNDVWDNAGGDYVATAPATHEISLDPRFVKPLRGRGRVDLALRADSPCIDAGDPDDVHPDPDGSRPDLGAIPWQHGDHVPRPQPDSLDAAGLLVRAEPNPCNPRTTISFDLAQGGPTRLAIYDLRGREVRRLIDGALPAGPQAVVWDGRTSAGEAAPSGLYFYRLLSGRRQATGRLTLLK